MSFFTLNAQEVSLSLLKTKIFYFILSSILFFSLINESLAQVKWSNSSKDSNSSKKGEWKEFIPKKGQANFDSNQTAKLGRHVAAPMQSTFVFVS